uniref:Uncharacterized protein n=1 Tax=Anguilla anguilla TaxID=7936 RepID=A0A0E9PDZ8_ANGAN
MDVGSNGSRLLTTFLMELELDSPYDSPSIHKRTKVTDCT